MFVLLAYIVSLIIIDSFMERTESIKKLDAKTKTQLITDTICEGFMIDLLRYDNEINRPS